MSLLCLLQPMQSNDKVRLEIYYEALCPDSYGFIRNDFASVYGRLGDKFIDVELIPYGKATVSMSSVSHVPLPKAIVIQSIGPRFPHIPLWYFLFAIFRKQL